jgi:ABC-2 type transport system ATP-binding protein
MDAVPVIETHNLTKHYAKQVAVQGISLTVKRGEIFGLIGSDGAGKTTILQALAAILDPTEGHATVLGHDTVRDATWVTAHIAYMSQSFTLYGRLTVEENLDFFASLHRVPFGVQQERKTQLLVFARLQQHRSRLASHLSGGMQKKLALCCALIHQPELLLLDEPTTGVDPVSRREFWNILYRALTDGTTIVVSTPYMDEAERCNRVALLHAGRLIACDAPNRLRSEMSGAMVEIKAYPQRKALALLKQTLPQTRPYIFGERIHLHVEEREDLSSLSALPVSGGVKMDQARQISPSLEDVFIARLAEREEAIPSTPVPDQSGQTETAVEAVELTMRFGDFIAVDGVSFSVRRGEIFGFLGPNGSGKTTTIRMLCGLLTPTSGRAAVTGYMLGENSQAVKSHIGYMSQRFFLYNDMMVEENINYFAGVYGVPPQKVGTRRNWALAQAGLQGQEKRLTGSLSGGMKQRLALSCAVLHEPEVLFLDEPTAGVDPLSRRRFWDLIYGLSDRGVTVFVTTHYMDEAEHCHRLGLLYAGRLIALGSPEDLRSGMRAGEMLELECDQPIAALALFQDTQRIRASFFGDRLHLLVDDAEAAKSLILERLRREGHQVRRIERVPLSIEDVFITFIEMEQSRLGTIDPANGGNL